MSVTVPPAARDGNRPFSLMDQMKRIGAHTFLDPKERSNLCASLVHVCIFFDGTNNNMARDKIEVFQKTGDPDKCYHSNVAVLYDTARDAPDEGYFSFYVPGVGTPFKDIGEREESPDGKAKGTGGDARINWAMLQLLNAIHSSIHKIPLVINEKMGPLATSSPLHKGQTTGPNLDGKQLYFGSRSESAGEGVLARLRRGLERQLPRRIARVKVSVFGFSRGAAQARAFCHFVHHVMLEKVEEHKGGGYALAGVPFEFQFLGLFDSVASVGLSDASPFWRGLGGWANGTLGIPPSVRRTVHLCAAHEIRISFPLSTARAGTAYPDRCVEKVYPGAHSDVGGGYAPGDQGKAVGSRSKLLSQVPLLDMYREAQLSMVPLLTMEQLRETGQRKSTFRDLQIDPQTADLFNAYLNWSAASTTGHDLETTLNSHMQLYWRWRLRHLGKVRQLPSFTLASPQARIDLIESDADFAADVALAAEVQSLVDYPPRTTQTRMEQLSEQRDFSRLYAQATHEPALPPKIEAFFDQLVHDSHATFYMAGPATPFDRQQKIAQIERKSAETRERFRLLAQGAQMKSCVAPPVGAEYATLSALERRIYDHQKTAVSPGEYPLITDADRDQLLEMEDLATSGSVRFVTRKTRRELGGHVRYRRVLNQS